MTIDAKILLLLKARKAAAVGHSLWRSYSELCDAKDSLSDLKEQFFDVKETLTETKEILKENRGPSDFELWLSTLERD